jgi:hypothetical protein
MPLSPTILAFALALPFTHPHAPDAQPYRQRIGAWTLSATRYEFAGAVKCELTSRHARYERGALVLRLPERIDTSGAVYRIDGGAPHWTSQDAFQLAKLGFRLSEDNLDNPSEGLVRIPAPSDDIRSVAVQTSAGGRLRTFTVNGLGAALYVAKGVGCTAFG